MEVILEELKRVENIGILKRGSRVINAEDRGKINRVNLRRGRRLREKKRGKRGKLIGGGRGGRRRREKRGKWEMGIRVRVRVFDFFEETTIAIGANEFGRG